LDVCIDRRSKTDIPGLYLTGQDVLTCGFAGALFSGVLTAQVHIRTLTDQASGLGIRRLRAQAKCRETDSTSLKGGSTGIGKLAAQVQNDEMTGIRRFAEQE
jgi:hypothetical protein